jgi:ATPase family associated with various cellular activities (AAA)/AAA+ lid domain
MSHRRAVHDLKSLVLSYHSLITIETVEEERVLSLLHEVATDLRLALYDWSLTNGFRRVQSAIHTEGTEDPLAALRHIGEIENTNSVFLLKDMAPHLTNPNLGRQLRELAQKMTASHSTLVITGDPVELPKDLDALGVRFRLELPDDDELREVVRAVVDSFSARQRVRIELTRDEAQHLVHALSGLSLAQARQVIAQTLVEDGRLNAADIQSVIRCKGEIIQRGGVLEFFPPAENMYQLGGFTRLKAWLADARAGFSPEAKAMNLEPPKGVLVVGVQGCGKSLAAKFIAHEWGLPLLKLDAGRLYEKYVGESEKNLRKAMDVAEAMAPVVLWIDEIEKVFSQGGGGDADGGLSQRLFGAFLTWLQEKKQEVFVVGAANDLLGVPPELLRKGRFDEIFFVDLPTAEERQSIASIHLALRRQDPKSFDLARIAAATDGFSGAEIEQAVISALYRSLHRKEKPGTDAVIEAAAATVPLSVARREDIERIRAMAAGRFTPVR